MPNKRQRKKVEKRSGDVIRHKSKVPFPGLGNVPVHIINRQTVLIDSVSAMWEQFLDQYPEAGKTIEVTDYEDITHKRIAGGK